MLGAPRTKGYFVLFVTLFASASAACGGTLDQNGEFIQEGDVGQDVAVLSVPPLDPKDPPPPPSLKTVKVPEPSNLGEYVRNKPAAIALGKALFWDMQVGSDGVQACATCHFHAGADSRSKNQLSPGLNRRNADLTPAPDRSFSFGGPNYQLKREDFPFRKLANPDDRNSRVLSDTNDVVSSQGVTAARFVDAEAGEDDDTVETIRDTDGFSVRGKNVRRVQERNAPTVINSVFNFRNFWDGRAQSTFNGVNAMGERDSSARILRAVGSELVFVEARIDNASLASQAMEPPLGFEMSAAGRTFNDIGEKMAGSEERKGRGCRLWRWQTKSLLALRPLGKQVVAADDSVLGAESRYPLPGLRTRTYRELIEEAFQPQYWQSDRLVRVGDDNKRSILAKGEGRPTDDDVLTLAEANFGLFFGLAIQLYEATLVSDDAPYDRFVEGDKSAMTEQQQRGLQLFLSQTRGKCINCHGGPEFTDAAVTRWSKNQIRRREGNILDFGFNNIGVRPTLEDLGNGGNDVFGNPLSVTRLALAGKFVDASMSPPLQAKGEIQAADGAFKVPTLRNVELTAPYFHNGGFLTLRQTLDFYSRGGDFLPIKNRDGQVISPLTTLNNTEEEKDALEAFLLALTDERVRLRKAPFDHPQIFVPNGHRGDERAVCSDWLGNAKDEMLEIAAVGKGGGRPLPNFLEQQR